MAPFGKLVKRPCEAEGCANEGTFVTSIYDHPIVLCPACMDVLTVLEERGIPIVNESDGSCDCAVCSRRRAQLKEVN